MEAVLAFVNRRVARGTPLGLGLTLAVLATAVALGLFLFAVDLATRDVDLFRLDADAHAALVRVVGPEREALVWGVTWLGNHDTITALVVLVSVVLVAARRPMLAFRVAFASGAGGLVSYGLKRLFARPRPLDSVVEATGYSLPSGHAFAATVFYGMMAFLVWRLVRAPGVRWTATAAAVVVIGAVGLSRVYLNVHFLTDVVAGWASGTAWVVSVLAAVHVAEHGWTMRAQRRADGRRAG